MLLAVATAWACKCSTKGVIDAWPPDGATDVPINTAVFVRDDTHDDYTLVVTVGKSGTSEGELYADDGDSFEHEAGQYIHRKFVFDKDASTFTSTEVGGRDTAPLHKAGSWLEGANLLAKAVKAAGKPDAADGLLEQPAVVDYFLTYVKSEGQARAPEAVTEKLEASLTTLKGIAEKETSLTAEDIDVVITTTDDVLALL